MVDWKEFNINQEDFEDMLLYAFRYGLGSQTFSAPTMATIVKNNLDKLNKRQLVVIKRDIVSYFSRVKAFENSENIHINEDLLTVQYSEGIEIPYQEKHWYDLLQEIHRFEELKKTGK